MRQVIPGDGGGERRLQHPVRLEEVVVEGMGGCGIPCGSRRRRRMASQATMERRGGCGIPCSLRRRQHPMQLEEAAVELTLGAHAPSRHRTNRRLRPVRCGGSRRRRRPGPQRRRRRHNVSKVEGTRRKEISLWLKYNVTYFTVHDTKKIIDPLFDWR
jgi:hypothetical protein